MPPNEGDTVVTRQSASLESSADVIVVNPLAGALQHYTSRLTEMLRTSGLSVVVITVPEPSFSGGSRIRWLKEYAAALRAAARLRHPGSRVVVTWPVLGHWDRLLAPLLARGRRTVVVMHDPKPLVRALGYGLMTTTIATLLAPKRSLIVHSQLAIDDLEGRAGPVVQLPHPLLHAGKLPTPSVPPVVRVLGQWKPDRDIELLELLAALLPDVRLEIVGRGWPRVGGWEVRDAFVPEADLDELINTSSAVLIPYQRYYQSGIAARAIEAAVPVIGRARELSSMTGSDYPFLVRGSAEARGWSEMIRAAIDSDPAVLEHARTAATERALVEWQRWARS